MKFTCEVDMDNASDGNDWEFELSNILLSIIMYKLRRTYTQGVCIDTNGNVVGRWEVK